MNFRILDDMRRLHEVTRPFRELDEVTRSFRQMDEVTSPFRHLAFRQMEEVTGPFRQLKDATNAFRQMDKMTRPFRQQALSQVDEVTRTFRQLDQITRLDYFKQLEVPLAEALRRVEGAGLKEEIQRILRYGERPAASAFEGLAAPTSVGFLAADDRVGLFSWRQPKDSLHGGFVLPRAESKPRKGSQNVRLVGEVVCKFCDGIIWRDTPELELVADVELRISMPAVPICHFCLRREEEEPGWFNKKLAELLNGERHQLRGIDGGEEGDGIGIGKLTLVTPIAESDDEDP